MDISKIIDSAIDFVATAKIDVKYKKNDVSVDVKHNNTQLKVEYKDNNEN